MTAIHVEQLEDISLKSFVLVLFRFSNLCGFPKYLHSDNSRSFICSHNIMNRFLNSSEYQYRFGIFQIKHLTIPVYSPWIGCVWEIKIKAIMSCLYKVIGRTKMNIYELLTLLSDIQNAINSCPYRCSSNLGLDIICPINFINPYVKEGLMFKATEESDICSEPPNRLDIVNSTAICEQYWTSLGGNTPQGANYTATCLPSRKLSKLDEPDTQDTAVEARTNS